MTDGPYELPSGWRWVTLGEVARREARLLKPSEQPEARFRYLGMEHVEADQWEEPQGIEAQGQEIKSQVIVFHPGLVLYGKLRPYLNKVVVPSFEGVASTEFVPIATRQEVLLPHYLGAFLRSPAFVVYATCNTTGSRQPRVRLEALWEATIPLPPLEEQRRIVARIEELMGKIREARRLREEAKRDADRLMPAALAEVFPRPGSSLSPGWRWVKLGQLAQYVNGYPFKASQWSDKGKPIIRIQNLTGTSPTYNCFDGTLSERYLVTPGTLLISWSATLDVFVWEVLRHGLTSISSKWKNYQKL